MEAVPSDAELTAAVADILGSENLESLTVRTMMGILGRRFEGVDLTQRKKFIKHEVDRLMHLRVPAPADEGELGGEGGGYEQQQQHLQAAYPPAGVPATCTFLRGCARCCGVGMCPSLADHMVVFWPFSPLV